MSREKVWTEAMEDFLREKYREGEPAALIAAELSRATGRRFTENTVRAKMMKMRRGEVTDLTRAPDRAIVVRMKAGADSKERVTCVLIYVEPLKLYYMASTQFPYRVVCAPTANQARLEMRRGLLSPKARRGVLTWEKVREIRRLWCTTDISLSRLEHHYGVKLNMVVRNERWCDKEYVPPDKPNPARNPEMVEIEGEVKGISQWLADGRCEIGESVFRKRLKRGVSGMALIKKLPPRQPPC